MPIAEGKAAYSFTLQDAEGDRVVVQDVSAIGARRSTALIRFDGKAVKHCHRLSGAADHPVNALEFLRAF